jgi:hypothetical protein
MNRKQRIEELSKKAGVSHDCLFRLLEAEKVKKLLKRKAFMRKEISQEIEAQLNEN